MEKLNDKQFYGYFVNVNKCEISPVVLTQKDFLKDCYSLIETDIIERVYIDKNHALIIDEEGLFKSPVVPFRILVDGVVHSFVGNAIIVGALPFDENFSQPALPITHFEKTVRFTNNQ
jgi:hypothetical protein